MDNSEDREIIECQHPEVIYYCLECGRQIINYDATYFCCHVCGGRGVEVICSECEHVIREEV